MYNSNTASPNALIITQSLDLLFPPSCKAIFAPTCWTSTHESLNILNFTSLKLNLLSFHSDLFIFFYNGKNTIPDSRICLQISTGPSAIALVYFPYSSPWLKSLLPLPSDWNNFSSNSNAFSAWPHFKHWQSHLLKHSSSFIPAFDSLHWLPSVLA